MERLAAAVFVALISLTLAMPAAAQWKWRDGGRVVYSDRPPPASIPERAILERPQGMQRGAVPPSPSGPSLVDATPAPVAAASAASAATEPALEAKLRKDAEEKAAKQKADEARLASTRADNCLRARGQLKLLDDGVRIAKVNEKGEREILDDKQRGDEQARIRKIIASDCK